MGQTAKEQRRKTILSDLERVRAKRRDVLDGGVSVSISGGSSVTNPTLADLAREEARLLRDLYRIDGGQMRTLPDFSE